MNTSGVKVEPLATDVAFGEDTFCITLADGRQITVPLEWFPRLRDATEEQRTLEWFPRLRDATEEQRKQWRLIGGGVGIHWKAIDEDISVESILALG